MAAERQSYLTCNGCGEACVQDGYTLKGETDECVRDEAADIGWLVGVGGGEDEDYCRECRGKL